MSSTKPTPTKLGYGGGGNYADIASPIASTPQRPKKRTGTTPATPSLAALSPLKKPTEHPLQRRQAGTHTVGDRSDPIFSPVLKVHGEEEHDHPDSKTAESVSPDSRSSLTRVTSPGTARIVAAPKASEAAPQTPPRRSYDDRVSPGVAPAAAYDEDMPDHMEELSYEEEEYEVEEFNPYLFIKLLPNYASVAPRYYQYALPKRAADAPRISLVLDLDETLVHCSVDPIPDADLTFPVEFGGQVYTVYVRKRPYLDKFLRMIAGRFEVTIFTASQRVYAERLLNLLDPRGQYIKYRLYRDSCLNVDGNFLKDLNILGRDLRQTVLVDNSPHAFGYQVDNGIPIESWFDDRSDTELLKLANFLFELEAAPDVRPVVRDRFRLGKLIEAAR